ncbi:hypothetical protein [Streptomyces sp. MMG1121]|uniref:hypothetical protein n=1 Tax=Streptomyces sp. MMG1121 TaxID=1415544 RepID=UPI000ACCC7E8|nr:hypothetical protein [Streptomyces sp. MMG1121]
MRHHIARLFRSLRRRRRPTGYQTGAWSPQPVRAVRPAGVPGIGLGSCGLPMGVEVGR